VCGFCNVWVCGFCNVWVCGFCNVWVCGFCNVWVFWKYVYLYILCFVLFRLCTFILICFVCTSVRTLPPSDNSIVVSNSNNNNNRYTISCMLQHFLGPSLITEFGRCLGLWGDGVLRTYCGHISVHVWSGKSNLTFIRPFQKRNLTFENHQGLRNPKV